jgi:hypothetical protein
MVPIRSRGLLLPLGMLLLLAAADWLVLLPGVPL